MTKILFLNKSLYKRDAFQYYRESRPVNSHPERETKCMKPAILLVCTLLLATPAVSEEHPQKLTSHNIKTVNRAFAAGEKLVYMISWSNIVNAGIATMEVTEETTSNARRVYLLHSQTRSVGLVETFYPVRDSVKSTVDAESLCSDSFILHESHGGRKRDRDMIFDHATNTVKVSLRGDSKTYPVPECVQDALSSLYYVRTRQDFTAGAPIVVDVHDSDKTWAVEVQTIGKEHIVTPAGAFDTIKIKTHPKYEGVFMNKGEIYIWLTDDVRKIPVLMKSKLSIGSIVATLTEMQEGVPKP